LDKEAVRERRNRRATKSLNFPVFGLKFHAQLIDGICPRPRCATEGLYILLFTPRPPNMLRILFMPSPLSHPAFQTRTQSCSCIQQINIIHLSVCLCIVHALSRVWYHLQLLAHSRSISLHPIYQPDPFYHHPSTAQPCILQTPFIIQNKGLPHRQNLHPQPKP
jgi:hypothetical protein